MSAQGHGHRIVQFQGDSGGVSGADRADAASGALGGGEPNNHINENNKDAVADVAGLGVDALNPFDA